MEGMSAKGVILEWLVARRPSRPLVPFVVRMTTPSL